MSRSPNTDLERLAALTDRLGRCADLDEVITATLEGLSTGFGFDHLLLMVLDETASRLFTIASHGYDRPGIGSEVEVGVGIIGMVAAQRRSMRVGNLQRMLLYARMAGPDDKEPAYEVPLPGLPQAHSQLAVPAIVMGNLLGVLAAESDQFGAFSAEDELLLAVVAHLAASAVELDRAGGRAQTTGDTSVSEDIRDTTATAASAGRVTGVRYFPVDGSTFIDGDYLIKGVPGRILWSLLRDYVEAGRTEFTNREVRLNPSLELPPFRDNLESRLILLKRRLDERAAPMQIEKTGWGRFRLIVDGALRLESNAAG